MRGNYGDTRGGRPVRHCAHCGHRIQGPGGYTDRTEGLVCRPCANAIMGVKE